MKIYRTALLAAVMMAVGPHMLAQQAEDALSADLALNIVQEAVRHCRADGVHVTAKVVDASNLEMALLRDSGASPVTLEFAQLKINTVILTGRPSGAGPDGAPEMIESASPNTPVFGGMIGLTPGALTAGVDAGGAIPIKVGNTMIGVVAVSGASSPAKDIECAKAGLNSVADKLR